MSKKQTAVEWLEEQIKEYGIIKPSLVSGFNILIKQAKAMHNEEVVDAYREGRSDQQSARNQSFYHRNAEQYYNETYGGE